MLESKFKKKFKEKLLEIRPNVEIFEPDPSRRRSAPDMMIFDGVNGDKEDQVWAALEFKRAKDADCRPNQPHNVERLNRKGYATFVYPENEQEVLYALEQLLPAT